MKRQIFSVSMMILFLLTLVPQVECSSSVGIRIGLFDSSDPRIEEFYGYGPVLSLEYERIHESGLGFKPIISLAYSTKKYQNENQSLTRILAGIMCTFHPLHEGYKFDPYIGFGYFYLYTNENSGEDFQDFSEGGFPSSAVGYAMDFGLDYDLTEHLSLSWQTRYSVSKVISRYSLGDLDYGGFSSGLGLRIYF